MSSKNKFNRYLGKEVLVHRHVRKADWSECEAIARESGMTIDRLIEKGADLRPKFPLVSERVEGVLDRVTAQYLVMTDGKRIAKHTIDMVEAK